MAGGGYQPPEAGSTGAWTEIQAVVLFSSPQADTVRSTYRTLYGLQANLQYEVRVRCRTLAGKAFGDFSDSLFIHIPSRSEDSGRSFSDVNGCVLDDVSVRFSLQRHTFLPRRCSYSELCVRWPS